ncbi:uncharacterized protein LOC100835550 [Brachypodium distachyon]|uniref:PHD-type zinc finger plants domain-containing protein n=1 Tax=Brachypodium distachyon TaxID=15368 RepID=I1IC92_BRADI|nr:uncharacterized protein LOC100835550 [Brachypodium distachyon]KQK00617.1 hypothetical protein BRADI_3g50700v3 [Brachypodium distachyon]|eukprot:XP_003572774.1 uncharacterized protein LOC100835550 [Brachypodium distachyon]
MSGTVCSMCGDVGFPDKLFRCARCRCRFQHSYCTNYYGDAAPAEAGAGVCDWCLSDDVLLKKRPPSAMQMQQHAAATGSEELFSNRSFGKVKVTGGGEQDQSSRRVNTKGAAVRRYKLLKDVLC